MDESVKNIKIALWDIINYSNLFAVILDKQMIIRLMNYCLAKSLGFENEKEAMGKNWFNFIEDSKQEIFSQIHKGVLLNELKYSETITDIMLPNKTIVPVRWFNARINKNYNWVFSVGFPLIHVEGESQIESIRAYYRDIIVKDRTMIKALRDVALCKESGCIPG